MVIGIILSFLVGPLCYGASSETTSKNQTVTEVEGIGSEIFERRGGYIHPFVSVTGYWTDNLFNLREDKKSDYIGVISPGIWLSIPRLKEQIPFVETSTVVPGGMVLSKRLKQYPRRYQAFLIYRADIERFKRYHAEDFVNHLLEARFQYNMRGGLTIDVNEQFIRSHDLRGTGVSRGLDKFHTNLFSITFTYDTGHRVVFRVDYINYRVDYRESRNDFRDRTDNFISIYTFYRLTPKTSVFLEYDFVNIDYDENIIPESKEHHFYGGIRWRITAKSLGQLKGGYGLKDFTDPAIETARETLIEAQLEHQFTPKTTLKLVATRKTNETNISATEYMVSNTLKAEYSHRITTKITVAVGATYETAHYKGALTLAGESKERQDRIYKFSIASSYDFREWLIAEGGYFYTKRESNFSIFDYTNNTIFLRVKTSL